MIVKLKRTPGRNAMCPCGSGKKWKKCHGRQKPPPAPEDAIVIYGIVFDRSDKSDGSDRSDLSDNPPPPPAPAAA